MRNDIAIKQNEQKQLERLAAQRELYSAAKRYFILQSILTLFIPVLLSVLAIYIESVSAYAALFGVCIFVVDLLLIEPVIKHKKNKAVKIQELFDCSVLSLSHSPLKVVNDISVEDILQHYDAHKKIATNIEKIRDWYPKVVSEVDIAIGRIICQRSSCWWDKNLRNKYCLILKAIAVILPLLILATCFLKNLPTIQFVLILSALVPFFQFTIKQYNENKDMDCRLENISNYINQTWNSILANNLSFEQLTIEARRIQDAIYDNRSNSPLVFDSFYKLFRNKDENTMNKAAEILVNEVTNRNFHESSH